MHLPDLLRLAPKAELHCHYMGTLRHATLADFAARNGTPLPPQLADGYRFSGFAEFIEIARIATTAFRTRDDFARVAYEAMQDGLAEANVVHREFHVEAQYHMAEGIPFETVIGGVLDGLRAAERDLGATSRVIVAIDRELSTPADAVDMVRRTLAVQDELVCGIGLSGPEGAGAPELFAEAFQLAAREGLHRTNHVCEDNQPVEKAPPVNYRVSRDLLLCERYDHGNNPVHDPEMLAEAARDGASFAVVTFPSAEERRAGRWASIRTMADAGVRMTINSDDPAMFGVRVDDCYTDLFDALGWGEDRARVLIDESFSASWLDDAAKAAALARVDAFFADALAAR
jgi:adenosine deaminase